MEFEELLELLEIEDPADFNFFEQFAELVESEEEIQEDALIQFFSEVNKESLEELTTNYFEDILNSVPEEATDFYSTLVGINQAFVATAASLDSDDNRALFAEMFYKFRNWLVFDAEVQCVNIETEEETSVSIIEALSMFRAQNLSDEEYSYDFDGIMEYPIDEYSLLISGYDEVEIEEDLYDDVDDD